MPRPNVDSRETDKVAALLGARTHRTLRFLHIMGTKFIRTVSNIYCRAENECPPQVQLAVTAVFTRPLPRISGVWTALAILLALIGALSAAVQLLTRFEFWDDEGYMLISLAHYINEGHLYTQTFSQYGPFYFYAQGIFFQLLHLPVTHDMGRLVTLAYWVASSLLATFFVFRFSKSTFLACAAGLSVMLVGIVLTVEPGHPQQVVLLLCMIAACLSLPSPFGRSHLRLFALGCVGAALVFTKVNVGVFYIAGLAYALICLLPSGRIRSIGVGLALIYAATAPWLLMHGQFNHGFRKYCLLATLGGVATFACGALVRPYHPLPIRAALYSVAGLLIGTVLMIVATSFQGMSVASLIWGVLINPLHHPDIIYVTLEISWFNLMFATIVTAGVIGVRLFGGRLAVSWWFNLLRCAAGIGSILVLALFLMLEYPISWIVALLPLTLIPGSHWQRNTHALFSRLFVTYMAVTQFLQPFPVAGSQMAIAAAPMILWAFLCITDGIAGLRTFSFKAFGISREYLRLDAVIGGAILIFYACVSIDFSAHSELGPASTRLKGATWLHLPEKQASELAAIAQSVRKNCDTLFTMPGMASFNLWSGIPTPNGWNMTNWMKGISSERQAEILGIMKEDPRACAIVHRDIVGFLSNDQTGAEELPLAHYVMTDMPELTKFGGYEVRVSPGRSSPWLQ